jgi:hypothetical protein
MQLAQQAAKERNVEVRILVPPSSLIEQKVQQLKEYCSDRVIDVRYIEQMTEFFIRHCYQPKTHLILRLSLALRKLY